jgi:hypothetical protein
MKTKMESIKVTRISFDHYGYKFYVLVLPMLEAPDDTGEWYDFYLGCEGYEPLDYLFGIQESKKNLVHYDYNFFETYIFDYMNEYIIEE